MPDVKRYSIGLLLVGMALIVAAAVPLVQALYGSASRAPLVRLDLPATPAPAVLQLERPVTAVPVLRVTLAPDLAGALQAAAPLGLRIYRPGGERRIEGREATRFGPLVQTVNGEPAAVLRLRFPVRDLPAGDWHVEFDAGAASGLIRGAELRLLAPQAGLMPAFMSALMLGTLGWLAALLGALQWVRAAAARPGARDPAGRDDRGDRARTVACHLGALLGYLLPFGHLLGPLALWLRWRQASAAVERAGRAALDFQLSVTIYALAGLLLSFFLIGIALLFALLVFHVAAVLVAARRTRRGLPVRYPLSLRLIAPAPENGS